ncbi:hypothetical protein LX36DRAFT_697002 [Colletotrichum falcatum]|nr:hypothetical protein LX36DRAFT_697002 [Colletotrichum falcatum]
MAAGPWAWHGMGWGGVGGYMGMSMGMGMDMGTVRSKQSIERVEYYRQAMGLPPKELKRVSDGWSEEREESTTTRTRSINPEEQQHRVHHDTRAHSHSNNYMLRDIFMSTLGPGATGVSLTPSCLPRVYLYL